MPFIYVSDNSRERISCDNSESHIKRRETKAEFVKVRAVLGCVYCKKQEGHGKACPGGQSSEFSVSFWLDDNPHLGQLSVMVQTLFYACQVVRCIICVW